MNWGLLVVVAVAVVVVGDGGGVAGVVGFDGTVGEMMRERRQVWSRTPPMS